MNYKDLKKIKCQCGSRKPLIKCCLISKVKNKISLSNILPPNPETNFSHQKCYMRVTNNCSEQISKEHMVSEGALKEVDDIIEVTGFPWLKNNSKQLHISVITSKILCTRHNSAFSAIDKEGIELVRAIKEFSKTNYSGRQKLAVFNGLDIERWLLKTLYGLLDSKNLQIEPNERLRAEIDEKCIDLLNGTVPHADKRGLFLRSEINTQITTKRILSISPIINKLKQNIQGITINMFGFDFLLSTCPINVENSKYRPNYIVFSTPRDSRVIHLVWPEKNKTEIVEFVTF